MIGWIERQSHVGSAAGFPLPDHNGHRGVPGKSEFAEVYLAGDRKQGFDVPSPDGFLRKWKERETGASTPERLSAWFVNLVVRSGDGRIIMAELKLDLDPRAERVCKSWGHRHRLLLRFTYPSKEESNQLVNGGVTLARGPLELSYRFTCYGSDLQEFADRLMSLHRSLTGEAAFISQDGSVEVVLRMANVGAGMMDVSVRLEEGSVSAVDESQIDDNVLTFDGFAIDQSYLPGLAAEVRAFLAENRISVKHPFFGK